MFFMNSGIGHNLYGSVSIVDIKIRNHHGKKKLVAIWRYKNINCVKLQESEIRFSNGRMIFNTGSEGFINIIPDSIARRYAHIVKGSGKIVTRGTMDKQSA